MRSSFSSVFFGGVGPEFLAHAFVHVFGERFGQTVGQSLQQDVVIIIVGGLELG